MTSKAGSAVTQSQVTPFEPGRSDGLELDGTCLRGEPVIESSPFGANWSTTMHNTTRNQTNGSASVPARIAARRTAGADCLGLIRSALSDVAVRLAVWAGDPRNHEEALSLRSTSSAVPPVHKSVSR